MFDVCTTIHTHAGSQYLQHLCQHFNEQAMARWNDHSGEIIFDIGHCLMQADERSLHIHCCAEQIVHLNALKELIRTHFDRFAQQEPQVLVWPGH